MRECHMEGIKTVSESIKGVGKELREGLSVDGLGLLRIAAAIALDGFQAMGNKHYKGLSEIGKGLLSVILFVTILCLNLTYNGEQSRHSILLATNMVANA